jgi:acylphosphatase
MKRHTAMAMVTAVLVMPLLSASTAVAQQQKAVEYLPARGLPTKGEFVVRLDLEQVTKKKVNTVLDAVNGVMPDGTDGVKAELKTFRKDALPGLIKGRDILYKAGVRQVVMIGQPTDPNASADDKASSDADANDSDDDPNSADVEFVLLKVAKGTTPEAVRAATVRAAMTSLKTAKPWIEEMQKRAESNPNMTAPSSKELKKQIDRMEKDIKDMRFSKWEDGWLLVAQKDTKVSDPLKGDAPQVKALAAALARSRNAPITIAYALSDEARARMVKDAMDNPMFGQMMTASARMEWISGWLDLTADPRIRAIVNFPNDSDAVKFQQGITQMIMMFGGLMSMGDDQGPKAEMVKSLLADLAPSRSTKEVQFTITTQTVRKMVILSEMPDDTGEEN